ncbi:MAG: phosphate ABC transporter, permease protein PstA, partial [Methanothrix sp.]|nr:phosphate ABC transporter, permease protein PstA [Methanothrix sp.]
MKIKPPLAASLLLSGMLFITALLSLLLQPHPGMLAIFWQAGLAADMILIIGSYLASRAASMKTAPFLILDMAISSSVIYLVYSGVIHAGFSLHRPLGLGASFDYTFLLPLLILICSLLCIKDALNIIYGYSARGREALVFLAVRMSAVLSLILLGGILFAIVYKGIWAINWEFLTEPHRRLGQAGGISTAIMGSFWMVLGAMIVSSPLGIGAAIYLHEYSRSQRLNRLITIAVSCLNGVPSVVFGLFGLAFLVRFFGVSLLSGSIILGLINIPTIILTCQEALKSVPNSL